MGQQPEHHCQTQTLFQEPDKTHSEVCPLSRHNELTDPSRVASNHNANPKREKVQTSVTVTPVKCTDISGERPTKLISTVAPSTTLSNTGNNTSPYLRLPPLTAFLWSPAIYHRFLTLFNACNIQRDDDCVKFLPANVHGNYRRGKHPFTCFPSTTSFVNAVVSFNASACVGREVPTAKQYPLIHLTSHF